MQYRYLRRNGHPFATLQFKKSGEYIAVVASVCGAQDQFSRKIGKLITDGRMKFFMEQQHKCCRAKNLKDLLKNPRRHVLLVEEEDFDENLFY